MRLTIAYDISMADTPYDHSLGDVAVDPETLAFYEQFEALLSGNTFRPNSGQLTFMISNSYPRDKMGRCVDEFFCKGV